MRVYELLHELINKFVPMDELTKVSLKNDASNFYAKAVQERTQIDEHNQYAKDYNEKFKNEEGFKPEPLKSVKLPHKIIAVCEQWYMRYVFAILFVIMVPKIKSYINGESEVDDDDNDEQDELAQYLEFKRFKTSNR